MQVRDIEKYTRDYLSAPFLEENVYYRRRCVLEQIKKYKHDIIVEIGCGMFPLFQYLQGDFKEYYVVEPSNIFADNAKKISGSCDKEKITVYNDYFEHVVDKMLSIKPDFIICSSLLHEVEDETSLLKAINKIATEVSVIHINVPNAMSMHRLIAASAGIIEDIYSKSETQKKLQQRVVYDLNSLKAVSIKNGFTVISEGSYFVKPFTHKQMDLMLEYQIIDKQILEGLWNLIKFFPENGSEIYVNLKKQNNKIEDM